MSSTFSRKALPWLMLTGMPSVRRCTKGIEGKDWEEMFDSYKVMSRTVGVKKLQEAQKAKALWAMKAAKDRKEEFYDLAREENISRRNKTRLELWEEHLKDPIASLDRALKCVESQYKIGSRLGGRQGRNDQR